MSQEAVRSGLEIIKGTSFFRTIDRCIERTSELKATARAVLNVFAWELDPEDVYQIVDARGGYILGPRFFVGPVAYSGIILAEEVWIASIATFLGVTSTPIVGVSTMGFGYLGLKTYQIYSWTKFLSCFTIVVYRAVDRAMKRFAESKRSNKKTEGEESEQIGKWHLTFEDFTNEKLDAEEFQKIGKEIASFVRMSDCVVIDYVRLEKKLIGLVRKYTLEKGESLS
ncbi:hypothetical protein ABW20_dc0107470 [Dactylellina cionopaga]|nr:hypothetical protein ABW20_dc0107470 [Dactylellina cionopaga]